MPHIIPIYILALYKIKKYKQVLKFGNKALEKDIAVNLKQLISRTVAYTLYITIQQKEEAHNLIKQSGDMAGPGKIAIKMWNGATVSYNEIYELILSSKNEVSAIIGNLLIHFQYTTIINLFEDESTKLRAMNIDFLYYAAILLLNDNEELIKKIPPELLGAARSFQGVIRRMQQKYYPELNLPDFEA